MWGGGRGEGDICHSIHPRPRRFGGSALKKLVISRLQMGVWGVAVIDIDNMD